MKLKEIKETKGKSSDYYGMDDVLGEEITIIEPITQDSDIREYKTKKENTYYCINIRHTEEKDLHFTKAALIALAEAMPQDPKESWQGYRVRINRIGSGFKTAYKIVVVGKTFEAASPQLSQVPQSPIIDSAGQVIDLLKHAPVGVLDDAFWKAVIPLCGGLAAAMIVVEKLRTEGKIINLFGTWAAT